MPTVDNIDVRILVENQPLWEYQEPNGDTEDSHRKVRYIESVAGQKFRVRLRLLPDFDLVRMQIRWFTTQIHFDGDEFATLSAFNVEGLEHRNDYLLTAKVVADVGLVTFRDDALGDWEVCALEFGALGTSKTLYQVPSDRS